MRRFITLATLGFVTTAAAQGDVEIKTTEVAAGVYMLSGRGGNIGVSSGSDGVFVIDDQYAPMAEKILAAIDAIAPEPPRFVINTHWHGDHTGGNEAMGEAGALLIAHDNVRERMSTKQFMEAFGREVEPAAAGALPVVTFTSSMTFHLNGDVIRVEHASHAHTDGDAFVHFEKANVIHAGDIYFNGTYPFIDASSGGGVDGVIAAVDRMLSLANSQTQIIPGHGPLASRADLTAYRDMLVKVRANVQQLIDTGASLEDAAAARPSKEFDARLGGGFIKPDVFAEHLYNDLSAE